AETVRAKMVPRYVRCQKSLSQNTVQDRHDEVEHEQNPDDGVVDVARRDRSQACSDCDGADQRPDVLRPKPS
ncbi:hypothetical protein Q6273_28530, partial [Klebsiella pneumoniae]